MSSHGSHVVYQGPSAYGGDCVAVVTGLGGRPSRNTKCPIPQLWILPAGEEPHTAQRSGCDASVCGTCELRPLVYASRKRAGLPTPTHKCYVRTHEAPLSIARALARGSYESTDLNSACAALHASGRPIRLGAFGDPAALPPWTVTALLSAARSAGQGHTGYSHAWRLQGAQWLRQYVMASVSNPVDLASAELAGWRAFVAYSGPEPHWPLWTRRKVARCPGSCARCLLCSGGEGPHVTIPSHK